MKMRFLLILAIGISLAPPVFADGVGPFNRSAEASVAGASACSAGMHDKQLADSGSQSNDGSGSGSSQSGSAY